MTLVILSDSPSLSLYMYTHMCTYVYIHIYTCICLYVHMHMLVCVCIHNLFIYVFIQTHTRVSPEFPPRDLPILGLAWRTHALLAADQRQHTCVGELE